MLRTEDFLRKEKREIVSHLTFTSAFILLLGLAAGACCWLYGLRLPWTIAAFFVVVLIIGSTVLFGDLLVHGRFFVEQEIAVWRNLAQRLWNSDFVWAFSGLWGLATAAVMISIGLAAYLNHNLSIGLLAAFIVFALSVVVYFFLPLVFDFLIERVIKGPGEEVDDLDEWNNSLTL